jgi:hypothetical protein
MTDKIVPIKTGPAPKPTGDGTPVRVMLAPKLLGRLDAFIGRQPDPKPPRGRAIKMLMREALNARRAVKKPEK